MTVLTTVSVDVTWMVVRPLDVVSVLSAPASLLPTPGVVEDRVIPGGSGSVEKPDKIVVVSVSVRNVVVAPTPPVPVPVPVPTIVELETPVPHPAVPVPIGHGKG